jgi:ribosome-associated protein
MTETETLIHHIQAGVQEKKGRHITIVDMTNLEAICRYFVICEGTSNTHILSISESVEEVVRKELKEKPLAIEGAANATWIVMDYGDVMVHIFDPRARAFYNLEHLWSDALLTAIPDIA